MTERAYDRQETAPHGSGGWQRAPSETRGRVADGEDVEQEKLRLGVSGLRILGLRVKGLSGFQGLRIFRAFFWGSGLWGLGLPGLKGFTDFGL